MMYNMMLRNIYDIRCMAWVLHRYDMLWPASWHSICRRNVVTRGRVV